MKKIFIAGLFLFIYLSVFAASSKPDDSIFFYIPVEEEIQYYMNFFERLKAIETKKIKHDEIVTFYDTFLKNEKYRNTYQSLLLESYLVSTKSDDVKKSIAEHISNKKYNDEFSKALLRLYSSKKESTIQNKKEQIQFNYKDRYYDENINLFNMKEIKFFDDKLGLVFFNENNWNVISFNDKEKNRDAVSFISGGGTNSISVSLTRYKIDDFNKFETDVINSPLHKKKYGNYKLNELSKEGILARSGADKIFLGAGYGNDALPGIESFTSTLYMYSEKNKCGYVISYYMNFSTINNNFEFRNRIYNHLLFQMILSWIEN